MDEEDQIESVILADCDEDDDYFFAVAEFDDAGFSDENRE